MVVHSVLPDALTAEVSTVLRAAGVSHHAHGYNAPMWAATVAAGDADAIALIGPYRSHDVAEAVEATAPAGLPMLAPVATWAGVTRNDEPGCDDAAQHRGTVLRLIARDTVVAERVAAELRRDGRRAFIVAGEHEYGVQLAGQLRMAGLPESGDPANADVVVLCGLVREPEIERAAELAPLPVIAFDGAQGAALGAGRDVLLALPHAPADGVDPEALFDGRVAAGHAARLVLDAAGQAEGDRAALLATLRRLGPFDEHGDPVDPPVWLWRARDDWSVVPERAL